MKLRYPMVSLAMVLSTAALAHTHLAASVPADKSRVQAPAAIELHFSAPARLTALTLQKGKDKAAAIKPLPAAAAADLSVPLPKLVAGDYEVNWRVAGEDGHVMSGKFAFTVDPASKSMPMQMPNGMKMEDHSHMDHMQVGSEKKPEGAAEQHKH